MALTITQQPQLYTPAYNEQYFAVISDEVGNWTDFKYKIEINIANVVNGNQVSNLFNFDVNPRLDGYCVHNPIELVKNFINRDYFNPTITQLTLAPNKMVNVTVNITEWYNGQANDLQGFEYVAYDACFKLSDFREFDFTNRQLFLYADVYNEIFYPDNRVTLNTDVWLHLNSYNFRAIYFTLKRNNVTIGSLNTTITPPSIQQFLYSNIGVPAITSLNPQSGDVVFIDFQDIQSDLTYLLSYKIVDICSRHKKNIIYYLKRDGNIAFMHFELVTTTEFKKQINDVRLSPNKLIEGIYGSNTWERSNKIVSTDIETTLTLNTNWITEKQSEQLSELWDSPLVWIKDEFNEYNPVTIVDTNYIVKQHSVDKMFNYSIKVETDNKETRQRAI